MAMATSLQAQLLTAWEASPLTLEQLRDSLGIAIDLSSLSRKLRGKQKMTTEEAEAFARALGVQIATGVAEPDEQTGPASGPTETSSPSSQVA